MQALNLLAEPLIRVALTSGERTRLTLPGVFAALMRDEIVSFPALRAHQRHAWHAFLVQVGALALLAAGRSEPPDDEATWTALLRGLTPDEPDDAPWSLVGPPDRPALLQPPLPGGALGELKNEIATPDALDMLVTAKNHDLKQEVMSAAQPDDWLFALVTLQTMEGFLGAGNYGISRMNGGFANRPAIGVAPRGGPGAHVRRDIRRLIELRAEAITGAIYAPSGGLGLVWLRPWDGATSLKPADLDLYYVEICRRVRLLVQDGRLLARAGGSKAPRIVPIPGGETGDPWAPVVKDRDGRKVLTVNAAGFGYRRMVDLMFDREGLDWAPLQNIADSDDQEGLALVARALVRGQGKTEGYHERVVPLSKAVRIRFQTGAADPVAQAAQERVALAGEMQGRVLKPALYSLFENGPDEIDYRDKGAERRAGRFLGLFEAEVDRDFFPRLWEEFEEGADGHGVRTAWVKGLRMQALALLDEADAGASKAVRRRYRARSRAEAVFDGALRRNGRLSPYFPGKAHDDAAA